MARSTISLRARSSPSGCHEAYGVSQYQQRRLQPLARTNTRDLLIKAYQLLQETPALELIELPMPVYKPKDDPREFVITNEGPGEWRITGGAIERSAAMTHWEHDGSVRRFQKIMATLGVDVALREAGVEEGDTVSIGEYELEWQE